MPQSHGLGRGLASLIPQKKSNDLSGGGSNVSVSTPEPLGKNPFGVKVASVTQVNPPTSAPIHTARNSSHPLKDLPDAASIPPLDVPVRISSSEGTPSETSPATLPSSNEKKQEGVSLAPIGKVVPNPHQPRIQFSEDKLMELAQSIREHGILQPLIVTRVGENFELIAGERRLQAAKIVGLSEVPVIVREAQEQQKFELAIIENIQRHDLNPIEEARAYERLSKEFQLSQEDIAKKMGRSRSAIANTLRLLQLPVEIQRAIIEETISEGHAKALLSIENPEKQRALFDLIVKQGLTVRETEVKTRELSTRPPRKTAPKNPDLEARERALSEVFGTKVRIAKTNVGGSIRIDYFSEEEFQAIFSKLSGSGQESPMR